LGFYLFSVRDVVFFFISFAIPSHAGRVYILQADTESEMNKWIALIKLYQQAKKDNFGAVPTNLTSAATQLSATPQQIDPNTSQAKPPNGTPSSAHVSANSNAEPKPDGTRDGDDVALLSLDLFSLVFLFCLSVYLFAIHSFPSHS
jgi:hypothetical protein